MEETMTADQKRAHMKVESLIRQAGIEPLLQRAVWSELPRLDPAMTLEDGVDEAVRRVKAATKKAAAHVNGEVVTAETADTEQPRDLRQRRPAVRVKYDSDGAPGEESLADTSEIIRRMAEARGGRPLVHSWNRR